MVILDRFGRKHWSSSAASEGRRRTSRERRTASGGDAAHWREGRSRRRGRGCWGRRRGGRRRGVFGGVAKRSGLFRKRWRRLWNAWERWANTATRSTAEHGRSAACERRTGLGKRGIEWRTVGFGFLRRRSRRRWIGDGGRER